jgi:tRNA(Ile)-lysidine synthase
MNLLTQFQQNWAMHFASLCKPSQKFLLALSGGEDSTVLAYLLHQSGIEFVAAHVNYQLRGDESNRDEKFVVSLCNELNIPLLLKRVDTQQYMAEQDLSVQVAARQIRYNWFDEIRISDESLANAWVITAHHANDAIETSMMHFFRGTGIQGLRGIPAINTTRKIIRPLLPFYKTQIDAFAIAQSISFVVDSSNATNHYTRNFFRNQLIPALESVFPAVQENLLSNISRFDEVAFLYKQAVNSHLKKMMVQKGAEWHVPVMKWKGIKPLNCLTWEIIEPFGFTAAQINEVIKLLEASNSSYVESPSYRIIKNRSWMIIAPLADMKANHILIEDFGKIQFSQGELLVSAHDSETVKTELSNSTSSTDTIRVEWLDAKTIQFPILLRQWTAGDYFYPLGMTKKKKVSKFLIDARLSKTAKEKVWVLEMDRKIIAIVGLRIDNRFRYTSDTQQLIKLVFKPN